MGCLIVIILFLIHPALGLIGLLLLTLLGGKNEMLTIYYDNQKAIVANEQTKTYKVMPKSEAAEYSKDKQTSLKPRLDLVNAMEMLLGFGYEEEEEWKIVISKN